ncbi:MAG: hypothetical protein V4525_02210 [Pseudomonadota bacterium]
MEETKRDYSHIQGWGADLHEKDRPAYPKERIPARDIGVHWEQPEQQKQTVKVLHSNEHPRYYSTFRQPQPSVEKFARAPLAIAKMIFAIGCFYYVPIERI